MSSNLNLQKKLNYTSEVSKSLTKLKNKSLKKNKEYRYSRPDNLARNYPSMKSIVLKKKIRPDYKSSDINNFLSYIDDTIGIPDNLRIVCHSHIMQDFLETKFDIVKKNNLNLEDIFDENLWTIFMKINDNLMKINDNYLPKLPKYISISRHGFSIANLIKSREKTTFFRSLLQKGQQLREIDAKLSIYGILTSLLNGSDLVRKERENGMNHRPDEIFVSVLIRTWMTAICLYLPHCMTYNKNPEGDINKKSDIPKKRDIIKNMSDYLFSPLKSKSPKKNNSEVSEQKDEKNMNMNFKLIVSPFLKENGKTFDNQPENIDIQIDNIKKFLEFLIKIKDIGFSDPQIRTNLQNINNFFQNNNSLIIYYGNHKYIFNMYEKGRINLSEKIGGSEFYTYKTTRIPINRDEYDSKNRTHLIENIKIFHGIEKPKKLNIQKYSRWCEPFSKKNITLTKNTSCKIKDEKDE